jgi:nucleoside-diphosphate-sugar epimerase
MTRTAITSSPRVLVTGALGFLGSHIAASVQRGWPEAELFAADLRAAEGPLRANLAEEAEVARLLEHACPTHVVHAAGTHGQASAKDAFLIHAVATEVLLRGLEKRGTPVRFASIGSSSQYGRQDPSSEPELLESHPDQPLSAYAVSKCAQEQLVAAAAAKGLVEPVYFRVFNPIGPRQAGPFLLPSLMRQLREAPAGGGAPVLLTVANRDSVRDFIDVRDVGDGAVAALRAPRAAGQRLNLCSGRGVSVEALAEALARAAGREVRFGVDPGLTRRPDIPYQRGSTAKMALLAGWRPAYALDRTLAEAWTV